MKTRSKTRQGMRIEGSAICGQAVPAPAIMTCGRTRLSRRRAPTSLAPRWARALGIALALSAARAPAGPPYATDDPQPTPYGGYEVYAYTQGARGPQWLEGSAGIDFNYGATPGLQLTAVVPVEWESARGLARRSGPGPVELAAKWRFVHLPRRGFDLAFFPRLVLPATQATRDDRHASLQLPLWLQFSGERWSSFGGGGCTLRGGAGTRDPCDLGWAVTRSHWYAALLFTW
jgi:hypothetical protein